MLFHPSARTLTRELTVARLSVTLNKELASWVESEAQRREVSKAQVIRDAVRQAHDRGTSQPAAQSDVQNRLAALERRVVALEQGSDELPEPPAAEIAAESPSTTGDPLVAAIEQFLEGRPPRNAHAEAAVLTTFQRLRAVEEAKTGDLREFVYERHGEDYSSAHSLWQSIQRYLEDIPGIEKAGHGRWAYAGDDIVRDELDR